MIKENFTRELVRLTKICLNKYLYNACFLKFERYLVAFIIVGN